MHNIIIGSSDNAFSLVVDGSDTFDTIKAKILEKEKTLTCHTNQQPPPQLPKQYKIPLIGSSGSQYFTLEVESSDTLDTVLGMIRGKELIPTNRRTLIFPKLHSPPPPPEDGFDRGLYYYIDWRSIPSPVTDFMQISVRIIYEDETFSLEVKRSDTIGNVKDKIFKTEGIKPFMQRLYFAGMLLEEDGAILSDYNIHGDSTLDLAFEYVGPLVISVEPIDGKKVSMQVTSHHEIGKVKSLIREKEGLLLDQPLTLVYAGEQLDDCCMLTDYNIQDETTLCVVDDDDKAPMIMQIHVKIVTFGKTISLQVKRSDTIHHVKTMIQDMEDVPARKQILFLPQKRLEDKSTLAEYYIRDQSTLHLLVYTPEMEHYEDGLADYSV